MSKYIKISVVTPVYNCASYLEQCILSILHQNYPNLEYIIIDGGSTDGSVEIIKKYEKHLKYWISEPDKGLYPALNKGFEKATGEVLGWVNSDDILLQNSLFTLSTIFKKFPQVNWFCGAPSLIDYTDKVVRIFECRKATKYHILLKRFNKIYLQQESTFWRKSLWLKEGPLDISYLYASDFNLWMKFFRSEKLYVGNIPIGAFRSHSNSQISRKFKNEYDREVALIINKEHKLLSKNEGQKLSRLKRLYKLKYLLKRFNIWSINERIYNLYSYPPTISYVNNSFVLENKRNYCKDI